MEKMCYHCKYRFFHLEGLCYPRSDIVCVAPVCKGFRSNIAKLVDEGKGSLISTRVAGSSFLKAIMSSIITRMNEGYFFYSPLGILLRQQRVTAMLERGKNETI